MPVPALAFNFIDFPCEKQIGSFPKLIFNLNWLVLHNLIFNCINKPDVDIRKDLYNNSV